jgi:shikimate kinase
MDARVGTQIKDSKLDATFNHARNQARLVGCKAAKRLILQQRRDTNVQCHLRSEIEVKKALATSQAPVASIVKESNEVQKKQLEPEQ